MANDNDSSTSSKRRRCINTSRTGPNYYVHPKEWVLGVVLLLSLPYLRPTPYELMSACSMDIAMRCGVSRQIENVDIIPNSYPPLPNNTTKKGEFYRDEFQRYFKRNQTTTIFGHNSSRFGFWGVDAMCDFPIPWSYIKGYCILDLQLNANNLPWVEKIQFKSLNGTNVRSSYLSKALTSPDDGLNFIVDGESDELAIMMAITMNAAPDGARYYYQYTDVERETILEYFLEEMIDWFGRSVLSFMPKDSYSSRAKRNAVITDTVWSRNELLDLAILVSKHQVLVTPSSSYKLVSHALVERVVHKMTIARAPSTGIIPESVSSSRHAPSLETATSQDATSSQPPPNGVRLEATKVVTRPRRRMLEGNADTMKRRTYQLNPLIDQCLYVNFMSGTLVTNICQQSVQQARDKQRQLNNYPGSVDVWKKDFSRFVLFVMDIFFWTFCLMSLFVVIPLLCSGRGRTERHMDRMKRRLEQMLNDPVLTYVPEEKGGDRLIEQLERKLQDWDSRERASKQIRGLVIRFRHHVTVIIILDALVSLFLSMFHIGPRVWVAERLLVWIGAWMLSYAIPIEHDATKATKLQLQKWNRLVGTTITSLFHRSGTTQSSSDDIQAPLLSDYTIDDGCKMETCGGMTRPWLNKSCIHVMDIGL